MRAPDRPFASSSRLPLRDRLRPRVEHAFAPSATAEHGWSYLQTIESNTSLTSDRLRRTYFLITITGVAFILLESGDIQDPTIAGTKLGDVSALVKLLPTYTAFLYFQSQVLFADLRVLSLVHREVSRLVIPTVYANRLDLPMLSSWPTFLGAPPLTAIGGDSGRHAAWLKRFTRLTASAAVLVPPIFLIYAYIELTRFGLSDVVVWASLIATLVSLTRAFAILASDDFVPILADPNPDLDADICTVERGTAPHSS